MDKLSTNDLSIGYHPKKVLISDINLSLKPGSFVGLIGQNGVGKSTLIRTLCGLQAPLSGNIRLSETNIEGLSQREIAKRLSVVLTGKPESLNLTVLELIALGRYPYLGWLGVLSDNDSEKVEQAISTMEINFLADKKLYELSDGQLQKVMIARALAQDTDLIILDEPTSHLDLKNKIEVLDLLKKISSSGKTILISTHEIQLSANVCDLFLCVDFQKPMIVGSPSSLIKEHVVHDYLHLPSNTKFQLI